MDVDWRKVATFLSLTFAIAWTTALVLFLSPVQYGSAAATVLVVAGYMWAPAIAALLTQWRWGESLRTGTGLYRGRVGWVALAWLAPLAVLGGTIGIGATFPGVSFTTDYGVFLAEMGLPPEQIEASIAALESFPGPPAVVLLGQALVSGLTVNAVAALGEELGWRGLLLNELAPLGFWRLSFVTGLAWGPWHAALIVQGHNFPGAPLLGIVVMTAWTVAASPMFTYLTLRAETVLAPTFFHGSFNAVASLSLVYLTGASNLLLSPVGVAGIGAAIVGTVVCSMHDRFVAAQRVTTGKPVDQIPSK
ncbi:Metal-dependent membrane protease, CAAX family [Halanaeroarchaeum sp. HSR-CO]|uniref:CPBP family intramembrane glutamic endopeptidase n=1 Tax=Halanaeroarchaeum sp. HSR-CO TaxID=2866382 RepID=UPI00217E8A39|nr:CPBP family intramembrane glutamic endopeptidase [Halanaeroarchaeum sp. HSR-CO]UWG47510.1 Metal-dependent membrane protease, CAAX family [Halanaeroarchaeum sp. HSR-CO]